MPAEYYSNIIPTRRAFLPSPTVQHTNYWYEHNSLGSIPQGVVDPLQPAGQGPSDPRQHRRSRHNSAADVFLSSGSLEYPHHHHHRYSQPQLQFYTPPYNRRAHGGWGGSNPRASPVQSQPIREYTADSDPHGLPLRPASASRHQHYTRDNSEEETGNNSELEIAPAPAASNEEVEKQLQANQSQINREHSREDTLPSYDQSELVSVAKQTMQKKKISENNASDPEAVMRWRTGSLQRDPNQNGQNSLNKNMRRLSLMSMASYKHANGGLESIADNIMSNHLTTGSKGEYLYYVIL